MTELVAIRASLEQCYDATESLAGRLDANPVARAVSLPGLGHARA